MSVYTGIPDTFSDDSVGVSSCFCQEAFVSSCEKGKPFSTLLAHLNLASPLFTYLTTPSLSSTVAVVARENVIGHIPRVGVTLFVRGAKNLEPFAYGTCILPPSIPLFGTFLLVAILRLVRER